MTTADRGPGGALRWARVVVVALVAALAVLVHHETVAAVHMSMGMRHAAVRASAPTPGPAHDVDGACAGAAVEHCCSAAGVDSLKLAAPQQSALDCSAAVRARAVAGRDVPGTTGRAPPDLSLLSRLLL